MRDFTTHATRLVFQMLFVCGICCSAMFSPATAQAQSIGDLASPLEAGSIIIPARIGVVAGLSINRQSGSFYSACDCIFENGVRGGWVLGGLYERNITENLMIGVRATIESRNVRAIFREYENLTLASLQSPNMTFRVPILFRHIGDAEFTTFAFTPYIQWYPSEDFFFSAGIQPNFLIGSKIRHTKELTEESILLPNGELALLQFAENGERTLELENQTFPETQAFQFGITLTIGYDIRLNREYNLTPMINLAVPFTNLSTRGENFRIMPFQFLLALKKTL